MRKVKLGVVGVDTGQLMICDPCYINSEWNSNDEFIDIRRYRDSLLDREFEYQKDFKNYESVIKEHGKTVNQLIKEGVWNDVEIPEKIAKIGNFSYVGCCETTLNASRDKQGGQLDYKMGHAGAGVVFNSGFGDGTYDVDAYIEDYGEMGQRIKKVVITLIDEDEIDRVKSIL